MLVFASSCDPVGSVLEHKIGRVMLGFDTHF